MYRSFILFIVIITIFLNACQSDKDIGWNTYPSSEEITALSTDTFSIIAYTQLTDSIRSDRTSQSLAGFYIDPVFGTTFAAFATQLNLPTTNVVFPTNITIDSLILHLEYFYIYGNPKQNYQLTYNVFTLRSDIPDTAIYSNRPIETGELIGSKTVIPNLRDSITLNDRNLPAQLRIPLSKNFAKKLVEAAYTGQLYNNTSFINFLKGIAVVPVYQGGQGCMVSFDVTSKNSGLTLYYHIDTTVYSYTFTIEKTTPRYTYFKHDYQNAHPALLAQLNGDSLPGKQTLFLQSMAGTKIIIKFPHIEKFSQGKVIIHQAKLLIPIDENDFTASTYPNPKILTLLKVNPNGQFEYILDYTSNSTQASTPNYDEETNTYSILLTLQLQDLIKKQDSTATFALMVSGNAVNPHRVVLTGPQHSKPMKLLVYYTPIK